MQARPARAADMARVFAGKVDVDESGQADDGRKLVFLEDVIPHPRARDDVWPSDKTWVVK